MIVGDMFSGIGGFSLAARWMGWETAWFAEIDPFASQVLAHHWPHVPNLGDVTRGDWSTVPRVDVLTGGFPCQPHSLAGNRLASSDDRDLFDEITRAIRCLRPRVVVLENVPGLFTSESGRFYGRVLSDLAACGYHVWWDVLSAADVGADHKRDRVWMLAFHGELANAERSGGGQSGVALDEKGRGVSATVGTESAPNVGSSGGDVGSAESAFGRRELKAGGARSGRPGYAGTSEQMGGTARGGRGTGPGLEIRRINGGCEGLGDAKCQREPQLQRSEPDQRGRDSDPNGKLGHAERAGLEGRARNERPDIRERGDGAAVGSIAATGVPVCWGDAVHVIGADGTVRPIPYAAAESGVKSGVCVVDNGISAGLARISGGTASESDEKDLAAAGWPVARHVKHRTAKLKAVGNSIVPLCAFTVFQQVERLLGAGHGIHQ